MCALKAHQSHESAAAFKPLLGPNTAMVTAMNGIPWWYFYKEGSQFDGRKLQSVDPDGAQWDLIGPERAIGCVVDPACEIIARESSSTMNLIASSSANQTAAARNVWSNCLKH